MVFRAGQRGRITAVLVSDLRSAVLAYREMQMWFMLKRGLRRPLTRGQT